MKTLILILLVIFLGGCATVKPGSADQKYMTLLMLKYEYDLTNDQLKKIRKAYFNGEIECSYNAAIGEVLYPIGDYSKF